MRAPVAIKVEVDVGGSIPLLALALRSLILLSAGRFASFCFTRLRALRSLVLALGRSMMVVSTSIGGCCRTKLGDGWSGDGMLCVVWCEVMGCCEWLGAKVLSPVTDLPTLPTPVPTYQYVLTYFSLPLKKHDFYRQIPPSPQRPQQ